MPRTPCINMPGWLCLGVFSIISLFKLTNMLHLLVLINEFKQTAWDGRSYIVSHANNFIKIQ